MAWWMEWSSFLLLVLTFWGCQRVMPYLRCELHLPRTCGTRKYPSPQSPDNQQE